MTMPMIGRGRSGIGRLAKMAADARWGGRGESKQVRVDRAAVAALLRVPERDRRRVATDAILRGVDAYYAD